MVFLHKCGESLTANFASDSRHGFLIHLHACQAVQACERCNGSFVDEQALLLQSGPHCTLAILQVHAVIIGCNTHWDILFLTSASRKHAYG